MWPLPRWAGPLEAFQAAGQVSLNTGRSGPGPREAGCAHAMAWPGSGPGAGAWVPMGKEVRPRGT